MADTDSEPDPEPGQRESSGRPEERNPEPIAKKGEIVVPGKFGLRLRASGIQMRWPRGSGEQADADPSLGSAPEDRRD
ncbi:hypothetical protein [Kribbella speibonae]|uniref:Uncharacterized protein n=1 Tax=Kribbella speibonae TaxID=1572660 RepID=A0A4R0J4G4_9ACTN|nr:hypothetical protein [Kribbella speibonae]TCC40839.1 hypothetical protein E0H92_03910 [Kribbella speibonae]